MKISKIKLKQIIKEQVEVAMGHTQIEEGEPLPREHEGEVITPSSVAGELWNLAAKVHSLGEDFFTDADSLSSWIESFMERNGIAQQYGLEEGEEAIEEGRCPDTHYWKSFGGQGGTCVKRTDGSKAPPSRPAGGVEQSRRYASGPKPKRWE